MKRPSLIWFAASSFVVVFAVAAISLVGCAPAGEADAAVDGGKYLTDEAPQGAAEVLAVRADAQDQDDVVVVGRIGGRTNPWIKDRAAFSIVDNSLTPCSEMEGDTCPTPWDYCCEADLPDATLLVSVVDDAGNIVPVDARKLLGVKELQTVVVQGKAKRDEAGNVSLLASKIHVRDQNDTTEAAN
jgi:hypothetical protein